MKERKSVKGESFAQYCLLSASLCNNRMDSRCQNDKQMDCHNLIKMQGIQKHSHCCIVPVVHSPELTQKFGIILKVW